MKADSERGVTGAWAYRARQESGLSVEQVAAELERRGQRVSPATVRGIESGSKKPGARLLLMLAKVLESAPPGLPVEVETRPSDLATVLAALTDELRAWREERGALKARVDELEAQVAELVLADPSGSGSEAPAAPDAAPVSGRPGR